MAIIGPRPVTIKIFKDFISNVTIKIFKDFISNVTIEI